MKYRLVGNNLVRYSYVLLCAVGHTVYTRSHPGSSRRLLVATMSLWRVLNHKKKWSAVVINTQRFKPMRERTTAVIFLSQRNPINSGQLGSRLQTKNSLISFQVYKSHSPKIKTMKFSVASIVALAALFSQASAASVLHCMSYCNP